MPDRKLSVRPAQLSDHEKIVDYFLQSDKSFQTGMGVDPAKLPSRQEWLKRLDEDFLMEADKKNFCYIIWLIDDIPSGHSSINKIIFGEEAYMHLHIWQTSLRQKGAGSAFVKLSIPYYFNTFRLKDLYCEPMATNPSPNKTLEKCGFEFVRSYDTIPGWINFHQTVNRWHLTKERFDMLYAGELKI